MRAISCVFALAALASALSVSSHAAEVSVYGEKEEGSPLIIIKGDIKPGDEEKFRVFAAQYAKATVLLNSDGGALIPAMEIGRTVRLRGYNTAIYGTDSCVSACALIWLAGDDRIVFAGGKVGFHASYLDSNGIKLESGLGNAMVGHYLSQLGYSQKAVVFATLAPPDKVLWLNESTSKGSGIEYTILPSRTQTTARAEPIAPPPFSVPMPMDQPPPKIPPISNDRLVLSEAKQTLRLPEAFANALRSRGFQASVSRDDKDSPRLTTGVGGEEIAVAFSGCDPTGCDYIQLLDYMNGVSEAEVKAAVSRAANDEVYSHPIWFPSMNNTISFYTYIVIGSDGITTQTLIDSMKYFVDDNKRQADEIIKLRRGK